jgi:DNA topoisomerase-1
VFKYVGKSGRTHEVTVDEPRVVQIVTMCLELPNQQLFQYVDDSGLVRDVGSVDVNDYLQVVSGSAFTSKDFRTWGATVSAGRTLVAGGPPFDESGEPLSAAALKRRETAAVRAASEAIRNRMATCRAYYVHPRLIDLYADGTLIEAFERARRAPSPRGLRTAERAVLHALGAPTRKAARPAGAERVAASVSRGGGIHPPRDSSGQVARSRASGRCER